MNRDIYSYLQKMHIFIEAQEKRIRLLESKIEALEKQAKDLKTRPPIHVDRIEYKFDQLKVESLDGTLNIGLNPADLQNIEDFAINNKGAEAPFHPKLHFQRTIEIEDRMSQFLENELNNLIQETAQTLNIPINDTHYAFIKEDIIKQLPVRIEYHLKQLQSDSSSREKIEPENIVDQIQKKIINEIKNGVHTFISNLPKTQEGNASE